MNIAGVTILYYPSPLTVQYIQTYLPFLKKLYIIDNTEKPLPELALSLQKLSNIVYIYDGENKGIAFRLNQALSLCLQEGFEWLLTMDQDSYFQPGQMEQYLFCIQNFAQKNMVAVFGVEYLQPLPAPAATCRYEEVAHLITSGSVVNVSLSQAVGGFDENLFIDEVDLEYCYRALRAGYKIIEIPSIFLNHHLGDVSQHISLKTLKKTNRTLHAPLRVYYMVRNFLYVQKKYKKYFPESIAHNKKDLQCRIKNNILYNKNKVLVLRYIALGFFDFKRKKMGKIQTKI